MDQTDGFAASSWLVRQVARSKQEQKSCYLTGMMRIKGIGRYNKTSNFRFDLICVHHVNQRPIDSFLLLQAGPCLIV